MNATQGFFLFLDKCRHPHRRAQFDPLKVRLQDPVQRRFQVVLAGEAGRTLRGVCGVSGQAYSAGAAEVPALGTAHDEGATSRDHLPYT